MVALKIATRFLKATKGQTTLIIMGIAVGVAVQIFVGILIGSLQSTLIDRTVGNSSQITIIPQENETTILGWEHIVTTVGKVNKVTAISPVADSPALVSKGQKGASVIVRGFQLDNADKIYGLYDAIYSGTNKLDKNQVIIGKELKDDLNLVLGDNISIYGATNAPIDVKIVGFYDLKVTSLNKAWVITNLPTAQIVLGLANSITSIEIKVSEIFTADKIANEIKKDLVGEQVVVLNWKEQNQQLLSGLQGQTISSIMIQTFVLVSVLIAIASVLAIKVVQKSREIGILKAMGIKDRDASLIFLYQGVILGFAGAMAGLFIGIFLLYGFSFGAKGADGTAIIDIYIDWTFIIASVIVAILSAAFAALLPARKTFRLNPIEVIRGG